MLLIEVECYFTTRLLDIIKKHLELETLFFKTWAINFILEEFGSSYCLYFKIRKFLNVEKGNYISAPVKQQKSSFIMQGLTMGFK